jgi:hypothetical protein
MDEQASRQATDLAMGLMRYDAGKMIHSASAYPRLQARVKRTIAYTPTDDGTAGFPTVCDSFKPLGRHSV